MKNVVVRIVEHDIPQEVLTESQAPFASPKIPAAGLCLGPGLKTGKYPLPGTRVVRTTVDFAQGCNLLIGQALVGFGAGAAQLRRIEFATQRVFHDAVSISTGFERRSFDSRYLGGGNGAPRSCGGRLNVPGASRNQRYEIVCRITYQNAVKILWVALRLHQSFASTAGAPAEIGVLWPRAGEGGDDFLCSFSGLLEGAIGIVDDFLGMPLCPFGIV